MVLLFQDTRRMRKSYAGNEDFGRLGEGGRHMNSELGAELLEILASLRPALQPAETVQMTAWADVTQVGSPLCSERTSAGDAAVRIVAAGHKERRQVESTSGRVAKGGSLRREIRPQRVGRCDQERPFNLVLGRCALIPEDREQATQAMSDEDRRRRGRGDCCVESGQPIVKSGTIPVGRLDADGRAIGAFPKRLPMLFVRSVDSGDDDQTCAILLFCRARFLTTSNSVRKRFTRSQLSERRAITSSLLTHGPPPLRSI